jgi:hypothetical protein
VIQKLICHQIPFFLGSPAKGWQGLTGTGTTFLSKIRYIYYYRLIFGQRVPNIFRSRIAAE